jgi:hypothetical protein
VENSPCRQKKTNLHQFSLEAIGACIGIPADLSLIRIKADSTLPAAHGCIVINNDWRFLFF